MRKIEIKSLFVSMILLLSMLIAIGVTADEYPPAATVDFVCLPASQSVDVGDTFTIGININPNGETLDSVSNDYIFWNYSMMELISVDFNSDFFTGSPIPVGETNYTPLPPSTGVPSGDTISWNYSLPYNLNNCNKSKTYFRLPSGSYELYVNGQKIINTTAGSTINYDLQNWTDAGAPTDVKYVNVTVYNWGGSKINACRLYMLDSNKRFMGLSNLFGDTDEQNYYANLTFKAIGLGTCNFYLGEAAAVYSSVNKDVSTTNCTVIIAYGDPPTITYPNPSNGQSDIDKDISSLSVLLNDPNGDTMDYSIECSNGDSTSGSRGNGTASLTLSTLPLSYDTTYTWWVNITDGFNVDNETYTFTVRSEYSCTPPSGFSATGISPSSIALSWTKGENCTHTRIQAKQGSYPSSISDGTNVYNGTSSSTTHSGLGMGETWYYRAWTWNSDDGVWSSSYAEDTGTTTTNQAPIFKYPQPPNASTNIPITRSGLSINIEDLEGDSMDWTIEFPATADDASDTSDSNGTKNCDITSYLDFDTTYYWYVNATDSGSGEYNRSKYHFTTLSHSGVSSFLASADGRFEIDLSWSDPSTGDYVLIEWNTSASWNRGEGTEIYNGTGTSYTHDGLDPGTTYYYRAWSWNQTKNLWSSASPANDATDANSAPSIDSIVPADSTTDLSIEYGEGNISLSDADGDSMNITLEFDGTSLYSGSGISGGTYTFNIYDEVGLLEYSTSYTVYVNITDGYDWTNDTITYTTGAKVSVSLDLVYLDSTKTGYNFVTILNTTKTKAEDIGDYLADTLNITWEYLTYWDNDAQEYSSNEYISGGLGDNFNINPGMALLVVVKENATYEDEGFSPTMEWESISVENGTNWFGRTYQNSSAYYLGENLTSYSVSWTQILYYDQYSQAWSNSFLPAYPQGHGTDFTINPGMATAVSTNATGTFKMGGW